MSMHSAFDGFQGLWRQRRKEQVGRLPVIAFPDFEHPPLGGD
jgi:hypothetical protein